MLLNAFLELARYWLRSVNANGVMNDETDLERLQSQVARAKESVRRTAMKVAELEASAEQLYRFNDRLIVFPRCTDGKLPVRVDRSKDEGNFFVT